MSDKDNAPDPKRDPAPRDEAPKPPKPDRPLEPEHFHGDEGRKPDITT